MRMIAASSHTVVASLLSPSVKPPPSPTAYTLGSGTPPHTPSGQAPCNAAPAPLHHLHNAHTCMHSQKQTGFRVIARAHTHTHTHTHTHACAHTHTPCACHPRTSTPSRAGHTTRSPTATTCSTSRRRRTRRQRSAARPSASDPPMATPTQ